MDMKQYKMLIVSVSKGPQGIQYNNAITNNFVAWKHCHVVTAVLARAQLWKGQFLLPTKSCSFSLCLFTPNFCGICSSKNRSLCFRKPFLFLMPDWSLSAPLNKLFLILNVFKVTVPLPYARIFSFLLLQTNCFFFLSQITVPLLNYFVHLLP